jgi:dipeptidyl aminopeptidase/acylaminoacyl peptidase
MHRGLLLKSRGRILLEAALLAALTTAVLMVVPAAGGNTASVPGAVPQKSPCAFSGAPAWSPDGKQIAWAGQRAICVAKANGSDAHPLHLHGHRLAPLRRPTPARLVWLRRNLLLYDDAGGLYGLRPHGVSSRLTVFVDYRFSVDAAGTRVTEGCQGSLGDFSDHFAVIELANGRETSIGDTTSWSCNPSLSPDGSHVVFGRSPQGPLGTCCSSIWTAATDGTNLQQLLDNAGPGFPRWSPHGDRIAYVARTQRPGDQLRLVSASGGASTQLVKRYVNPEPVPTWDNSWSPNGRLFAFVNSKGLLSIVNTATHRVSTPRQPSKGQIPGIAWSPNAKQHLEWRSTYRRGIFCDALWRVPVNGGKPFLISRFCKRRR